MKLLEYEAKKILEKYNIKIPEYQIVSIGDSLDIDRDMVLKAQVPIGGRGKAGGILNGSSVQSIQDAAEQLFSSSIRGYQVKKLLLEEKIDVQHEYFMAITYDALSKAPLAIFSAKGGVDIEALSIIEPEMVSRETFSIRDGLPRHRAREIISETGVSGKLLLGLGTILSQMAAVFIDYDATLVEINPVALTQDGHLVALDCHLDIDDDAVFRHSDMNTLQNDETRVASKNSQSQFERDAEKIDQIDHRGVAGRVIEFDGSIGLIIGGGGASLTAFDAIKDKGGKPANYCEIGGNPSVIKVKKLTRLLLKKSNVQKIAVIMNVVSNTRVDLVARGIIKGILESNRDPSEVIAAFRIPGAWEEEGAKILSKYGVAFLDRSVSIDEAAAIAVKNIQG